MNSLSESFNVNIPFTFTYVLTTNELTFYKGDTNKLGL